MNTIDELLSGAANRLDHATASVSAPAFEPSAPRGGRIAVGVVCVAALAATTYAVVIREPDRAQVASLPPGLREGRFGTEVVMNDVPDGDDDASTFVLHAEPDGGDVTVTKPTGNTVSVTVEGEGNVSSAADVCLDTSGAGGACGGGAAVLGVTQMISGERGADGQIVVYGLPADAVAVTVAAGDEHHWGQPVHGVVSFPYPETAAPTATARALDIAGKVIWEQSSTDITLTPAEIATAAITVQTPESIPNGWFGDIGPGDGYGPEVIRRRGRTSLTGFTGPFAAQGYIHDMEHPSDPGSWIWAITVRTADVDAVRQRIDPLGSGSIRKVVEPNADVRVLVWGGDDVPGPEIDRYVSTLTERDPMSDRDLDLDQAGSFGTQDRSPYAGDDGLPLAAMVTDVVGEVDGHDIIALADDVGVVQFHVADGTSSWAVVGGRGNTLQLPAVGNGVFSGLWPIPVGVSAISFVLDDGTTVTPQLVDVRPLAEATLMVMPPVDGHPIIVSVDITR